MGGRGSGNWYRWNKKAVIEDCRCLDINWMVKLGAIPKCGWRNGSWIWTDSETGETNSTIGYEADTRVPENSFLRVHYTFTESQKRIDYKIRLSRSKANYGGERFWFLCPVTGKRVSKLYLHPGGDIFASRHAYGLAYRTQSESWEYRAVSKKWKIVRKAGGDCYPVRPKGMHKKNYGKIVSDFCRQEELCDRILCQKMGMLEEFLNPRRP